MNQFFSFERFKLLALKHWADNRKRYTLSVLAYVGILFTWFIFSLTNRDKMSEEIQLGTYFFSLFVAGTLYASQYFADLSSRPKGINFLLVPASRFEKFLSSLLYTVVFFFVFLTVAFYIVDALMVILFNAISGASEAGEKASVVNVLQLDYIKFGPNAAINVLAVFLAIQAIFLFGSAYFKKYNFLKTIISGFVAFLIGFFILYLTYPVLFPQDKVPAWMALVISLLLMYFVAPLFWILTYRQLKRKQV